MADTHEQNDDLAVHNVVDDSVVADAQPMAVVVPGEFLDIDVLKPRIIPERGEGPQDRKRGRVRHGPEVLDRPLAPPERILHAMLFAGSSSKIAATTSDML